MVKINKHECDPTLLPKRSPPFWFSQLLMQMGRKPFGCRRKNLEHRRLLQTKWKLSPLIVKTECLLLNSPQSLWGSAGRARAAPTALSQSAQAPSRRGRCAGLAFYALRVSPPGGHLPPPRSPEGPPENVYLMASNPSPEKNSTRKVPFRSAKTIWTLRFLTRGASSAGRGRGGASRAKPFRLPPGRAPARKAAKKPFRGSPAARGGWGLER